MRTELFVSRTPRGFCVARREDGVTVEFRVEDPAAPGRPGNILKARVVNVVPSLQAAFLDIGGSRNAFLHASDLVLTGETAPTAPIQDRLKPGRELVVQIRREFDSDKGDQVTCRLGIPGRLLVLLPVLPQVEISRRIEEPAERKRLQELLAELGGGTVGFLARTAAQGVGRERLEAEAARLLEIWGDARRLAERTGVPAVIHQQPALYLRVLRDAPAEGLRRAVFDDPAAAEQARAMLDEIDPALGRAIALHDGARPLFETYGLDQELERALRPRVWLACGGSIVIEQTEALVSIDVNTAKAVRAGDPEVAAVQINLEAAAEIGRQVRLRGLGGIVVVDFVDMEEPVHRDRLMETMEQVLRRDPVRTRIVGLSEIGLLEFTRERTHGGPAVALTRPCPACEGRGRIKRGH